MLHFPDSFPEHHILSECLQQSSRQCMHGTEHNAKTTAIFEKKRGMKDVSRELRQGEKQCWERWCGGEWIHQESLLGKVNYGAMPSKH